MAQGGTAPYVWSLIEGCLPPGLVLDTQGSVSGSALFTGIWYALFEVGDGAAATARAELPLQVQGDAHVLITEVMYDPPGSDTASSEWIELYNPAGHPVDVSGYTVADSAGTTTTDTLPPNTVIPANGCLIWATSRTRFLALYGREAEASLSLSLGNSGESVTLRDRSGALVDLVGFEITGWTSVNAASTSIERTSLTDTDTAFDWQVVANPSGASNPGNPGTFAAAPSTDRAPVVDAGPDVVVHAGESVSLAGAATDAEGDSLMFRWSTGARGASPSVTFAQTGATPVTLSVCDGVIHGEDDLVAFVLDPLDPILGRIRYNLPPRAHRLDIDLVAFINDAQTTLDVAMFEINRAVIVNALVAAKGRGVQVRVSTDGENYLTASNLPFYQQLENAGIPVYRDVTTAFSHNKFVVADAQRVWTGSFNSTDNDADSNANDAFALTSQTLALSYENEFQEFAGGRFGASKTNAPPEEHVLQGQRVSVHFSPRGNVRQKIIDAISSAQVSIDFAIFTFTNPDIRDALIARAHAGVQVRGIFDAAQAGSAFSAYATLAADPSVAVRKDAFSGLLHHKFLVVDAGTASDPTVVTGSYNWTDSAETSNDENVVIVHDAGTAMQYRWRFDTLYLGP